MKTKVENLTREMNSYEVTGIIHLLNKYFNTDLNNSYCGQYNDGLNVDDWPEIHPPGYPNLRGIEMMINYDLLLQFWNEEGEESIYKGLSYGDINQDNPLRDVDEDHFIYPYTIRFN